MLLDRRVALAVQDSGIDSMMRGKWYAEVLKTPGTFWFTIVVAITAFISRRLSLPEVLFVTLAGISSASNVIVKWIVGRTRPFKLPGDDGPYPFHLQPLWHGIRGLFTETNLSFPSGHACTAFALATAICLLRPRWSRFFFVVAVAVSAERVMENAHYFSDTVGAAGIGAAGAIIVHRLMRRWLSGSAPVQS